MPLYRRVYKALPIPNQSNTVPVPGDGRGRLCVRRASLPCFPGDSPHMWCQMPGRPAGPWLDMIARNGQKPATKLTLSKAICRTLAARVFALVDDP